MRPSTIHPDTDRVRITLDAFCHTCQRRHQMERSPAGFTHDLWAWEGLHRGHDFEFLSPRRRIPPRFWDRVWQRLGIAPWWLEYRENANLKPVYAAATTLTCTLASLASSTTFLAGQETTSVLNNTPGVNYIDVRVSPKITVGTAPTADRELRIYAYAALNDTPAYPDTLIGSNAAVAISNAQNLDGAFVLLGATAVAGTSNLPYTPKCLTLAGAYTHCPARWGLYITQSTGAVLHATAGLHVLTYTGAYLNAA